MIKSIRIQGFKSYQDSTLRLSQVTFLIGANGAGKSNAIDALRFLNWMGRGVRLDDIDSRLGSAPGQVRGTSDDLFRSGLASFDFEIELSKNKSATFQQTIASASRGVEQERTLVVSSERLCCAGRKQPYYCLRKQTASKFSDSVDVEYDNFSRGGNKPRITCSNRQAIFYQLLSESRFESARSKKEIPDCARMVKDSLGQILFLDADLSKMRGYTRKLKGRALEKDASNISSVVYNICQDQKLKRELLALIQALPELNISNISFVETEIGDVMLQLHEGVAGGRITPITLLSDGTLRLLAIAACVLSAPAGSMVVIEEIDNGLHPSRAKHVVDSLYRIADERKIQMLVTTHNPALMSAIPIKKVGEVLCCYRNHFQGSSEVLCLGDVPRFVELSMKGKLGDLATSNILDEVVKDNRTADQIVAERQRQIDELSELFAKGSEA